MTLEPLEYSPTGVNLYGSAIATSAQEQFEPATFRDVTHWFHRVETSVDVLTGRTIRRNVGVNPEKVRITQIRMTDPRTGWGQADDMVKTATSTAWQAYRRHLLLPPLERTATLGNAESTIMAWCHFGSPKQLVMVTGDSSANLGVAKETSATDSTPVLLTYNPGVIVQGCAPIIIGGATSAERVAIFLNATATEVWSNLTPTSSGSMHANTASTWAIFHSNVNASNPGTGTLIIYAGNTIYTLAITSALAAAPTAVLTNVPAGGVALTGGSNGVEALQKNWLNRAYMWWPQQSSTSVGYDAGTNLGGYVVSINLEGTGVEIVPTTLPTCFWACLWNRTVVQTDRLRIVSYDGETERDLRFLKGRESSSDYRWSCAGLAVDGGDLYALALREDLTTADVITLGNTSLQLEKYNPELDEWVPVSGSLTLTSISGNTSREMIYGPSGYVLNPGMSMPISKQTGFLHLHMRTTAWTRLWLPPEGVNPFLHYNKTGSADEISQQWATSAVVTFSKFPIRGYHGLPSVWLGCSAAEMDIAAGGTGAKVTIAVATQDGTSLSFTGALEEEFLDTEPIDTLTRWWVDNTDVITLGQFRLTLTQGSDDNKTPNALPVILYVMTFLDGKVVSPQEAGFTGWDV